MTKTRPLDGIRVIDFSRVLAGPLVGQILGDLGVRLLSLATWREVLAEAKARGSFDAASLANVEAFLDDPEGWQAAHE